jgi:UDPglucose 6-dehydrogenase
VNLSVIGTGYVGLVTASCFAELGHSVTATDSNEGVLRRLQQGETPLYEPGLPELVKKNIDTGRLRFVPTVHEAVHPADVVFITVGTPAKLDGSSDLVYIDQVAQDLAAALNGYKVIVEKSTVPVQTGERIKRAIRLYNSRADFDVASVPEFTREGSAIQDFMHPDRIVIGVDSPKAEVLLRGLYESFGAPLVVTDINSAELIKHASNSFLAMKISYINTIAALCEKTGADIKKVAEGVGLDRRIGPEFLQAGVGYGGSCLPKDVSAFIRISQELGVDFQMLKAVAEVNEQQHRRVIEKLKDILWILTGKTIAVLGLSFKAGTDDVRNSPALAIVDLLWQEGAQVVAYDPIAAANAQKALPGLRCCPDPYTAATGAHALLLVTDWLEFRALDFGKLKGLMRIPAIVDGRNMFSPDELRRLGFEYRGFGRR